ncbi:UNVERIFIED_CONTAM: PiggyBac transposable element-derived protein 3 [Trichonephila clavipes]
MHVADKANLDPLDKFAKLQPLTNRLKGTMHEVCSKRNGKNLTAKYEEYDLAASVILQFAYALTDEPPGKYHFVFGKFFPLVLPSLMNSAQWAIRQQVP